MKTENFTCDICGHTTTKWMPTARLSIDGAGETYLFHVCETCWTETPKGVFQKAFNQFLRLLGLKKNVQSRPRST